MSEQSIYCARYHRGGAVVIASDTIGNKAGEIPATPTSTIAPYEREQVGPNLANVDVYQVGK